MCNEVACSAVSLVQLMVYQTLFKQIVLVFFYSYMDLFEGCVVTQKERKRKIDQPGKNRDELREATRPPCSV